MFANVKESDLPRRTQAELMISLTVAVADRMGRSKEIEPQSIKALIACLLVNPYF